MNSGRPVNGGRCERGGRWLSFGFGVDRSCSVTDGGVGAWSPPTPVALRAAVPLPALAGRTQPYLSSAVAALPQPPMLFGQRGLSYAPLTVIARFFMLVDIAQGFSSTPCFYGPEPPTKPS